MCQRNLVPVDGSDWADGGLSEAIALARLTGVRIRLVPRLSPVPALLVRHE